MFGAPYLGLLLRLFKIFTEHLLSPLGSTEFEIEVLDPLGGLGVLLLKRGKLLFLLIGAMLFQFAFQLGLLLLGKESLVRGIGVFLFQFFHIRIVRREIIFELFALLLGLRKYLSPFFEWLPWVAFNWEASLSCSYFHPPAIHA